MPLPRGAVLVLWTDGLTDRRSAAGFVTADVSALVAAADEVGARGDDVSLLLARRA